MGNLLSDGTPHRFSFKNNFLTGITLAPWIRILVSNWRFVDWGHYWHRVAFLSVMAAFNSGAGLVDWLINGRAIASQPLHPQPVFILGHPRTGTTHLHNLLSQDTDRFAYCDTLMAGFPSSFMAVEPLKGLLRPVLDDTRPMDGMAMDFELPAEDEIATSGLSGGISPYLSLLFMNRRRHFGRFLTFKDASPAERARWRDSFLWFMRKTTLACSRRRPFSRRQQSAQPLLIKSPVHTARIAALLELFPDARFVFIHRDPLEVFQSSMHMANSYFWYCSLHQQTEAEVLDYTLTQGEDMMAAYCEQRRLIPPGRLIEVAFTDLEREPAACLAQIYRQFGWENFETLQPHLDAYTTSLAAFRKNQHKPLPSGVPELVHRRWRQAFTEFGYPAPAADVHRHRD